MSRHLARKLASSDSLSKRAMHDLICYALVAILSSYIVIDFLLYHADSPYFPFHLPSLPTSWGTSGKDAQNCTHREDFLDAESSHVSGQDPWRQMKWIGQAAACTVKGQLIEKLDEENNFRRGFALKFVNDVEDKTHILPWLLGSRINFNDRKRRVYLDLGANQFDSSVGWFLRMYPCDFTEIHAFEVDSRKWRPPEEAFDERANVIETNRAVRVKQNAGIPQWMLDRIKVHFKYVADVDDEKKGMVNITRFIKEELGLKASDAVVVKMDIEGSEWPILKRWLEDKDMPNIIDELFVEVHYAHPSMTLYGWNNFSPTKREDATRLFADLRQKGFYAHAWP